MSKRPRRKLKKGGKPKSAKRAAARPVAKRGARKAPKKAAPRTRTRRTSRSKPPIETLATPPSSLDPNRRRRAATAASTGHQAIAENRRRHSKMDVVTAGDVDADMESAYFTGDEAPGGDNPTPDQSDVDEIGHAMGVEYQDNEELEGTPRLDERDKHRWELDPASSDDYKDRRR